MSSPLKNNIFIVDDDPITISLITKHIDRCEICNMNVMTFPSGDLALLEAIKMKEKGEEIALCIVDFYMEPLNGGETLIGLEELFPNAKKILMTGHVEANWVSSIIEKIPLFRYIGKPWQGKDFEITIKEAIRMYNYEREILIRNQELENIKKNLESLVQERTLEISNKNKELEESLVYARVIQESFLPDLEDLRGSFKNVHLFNQPCNTVSGDFIWSKKFGDDILIAVADSTGHGLAGALITSVTSNIFDQKFSHSELRDDLSALIKTCVQELKSKLNKTFFYREHFIGMDMAVVKVNLISKQMDWASLNGNLLVVNQKLETEILSKSKGFVLQENLQEKITSGSINIEDKKVIMLSDGIYDQLNGDSFKRLKLSGLIDYIRQGEVFSFEFCFIEKIIYDWKKNTSNTDDMIWLSFEL